MSIDPHALPPTPDRVCSQALIASVPSFPARGSLGERLRQQRAASLERIRSFHAGGGAGLSTARLVTAAADAALGALWDVLAPAHELQGAVLVGVGGTGRREMSPGSDWDLLLLHTGRGEVASFARAFTTALWDARVHLGWSVRTLAEATTAAREDTNLRTALLDARRIAGDGRLWSRAERSLLAEQRTRDADALRPGQDPGAPGAPREVRRDRLPPRAEREERAGRPPRPRGRALGRAGPLPCPDAGTGPRAGHASPARRRRGPRRPRLPLARPPLRPPRLRTQGGPAHLRPAGEPRRRSSATARGPEGEAVERFMRHVYLAAGTLRRESDALLARAEEERTPRRIFRPERRVGHFKVFRGRLTVDDGSLFQRSPAEVVRMFQLAGELGVPLYSWARERIAEALPALVDARGAPEVVEALKALFTSPAGRGAVLDEMHALGVLGALVPEFGRHHRAPPERPVPRVHGGRSHPARAPAALCAARRRAGGRRARARRG